MITASSLVVSLLACGGGTNVKVSGPTGATRIWAFSDGNPVRPVSDYAASLASRRDELCQTAESGSKAVSLAQAIASLEAVLTAAGGPDSLTRLAGTKVGKSGAYAENLAAAEIVKGNPGGALAALLIAHRIEPKEARHLENAAVMAASLGYPQEALALLNAAMSLPEHGFAAMGIDRTARMLNNRAYALIRLGRWSEAVPLLNTAIAREPLLNEAKRNLAVALTCLGNTSAAGAAKRAGQRRNNFQDIGDPAKPQRFDPAQAYDLSHGKSVKLPEVTYPMTLEQTVGAQPKFESESSSRMSESKALLSQVLSSPTESGKKSPLTTIRSVHIFDIAGNVRATPQVAQLFETWFGDLKLLGDLANKWNKDFAATVGDCSSRSTLASDQIRCWQDWCSREQPKAQKAWYPAVRQTDAALRAWAEAYSRVASGLAANLADPAAHRWVLLDEAYWLKSNYALLLFTASTWVTIMASEKGNCFDKAADSGAETGNGDNASGDECTGLIGGANFSISLHVVSISVSCEEVGIEADAPVGEGGIAEAGVFASLTYKFKDSSTTLFAGPYAKTAEIGGLSAGTKAGVYITFDQDSNMRDVGMRGEASIDQSAGVVSTTIAGDSVDWSFVAAADGM